jgi:hypothetical protein
MNLITAECADGDHRHCDYYPQCICPCHHKERTA